jgi:hypothetical protein
MQYNNLLRASRNGLALAGSRCVLFIASNARIVLKGKGTDEMRTCTTLTRPLTTKIKLR